MKKFAAAFVVLALLGPPASLAAQLGPPTGTDITGTLFTLHGSSGSDQSVTGGSTVNILAGGSGNLTAAASATKARMTLALSAKDC